MKKYLIVVVAIFLVFFFVFFLKLFKPNYGTFSLVNETTQEVIKGSVEVCRQKFGFTNLKPNKSISFLFKVHGDSHYTIIVEFISGEKLEKEVGYITSGITVKDLLVVKQDDIILKDSHTIQ